MRCEIGEGQGEVSSRDGELENFSCEVGPGRGEGSSFPGEQGAVGCGLADISRQMDPVCGEGSAVEVSTETMQ